MILFVLAHGLAKCSVLALLMRMTPKRKQLLVFKGTLVFLGIGTVAFALAFALQCSLSHPWLVVGEQCPGSVCLFFQKDHCAVKLLTLHALVPALAGVRRVRCIHRSWFVHFGHLFGLEHSTIPKEQSYCSSRVWPPAAVSFICP